MNFVNHAANLPEAMMGQLISGFEEMPAVKMIMKRSRTSSLHAKWAENFEDAQLHRRYATQIAERLVATREALGLTQAELCRRAGMLQSTWSNYEAGARSAEDGRDRMINVISLPFALRLVVAFGITLDWIYMGDPSGLRASLRDKLPNSMAW